MFVKTICAALLVSATAAPAYAAVAIEGTSGGSSFGSFSASATNDTVGWAFDVLDSLNVTSLGWRITNGAVNNAKQIGIWSSSGTLLGSINLSAGAATSGDYRFFAISPITLASGQRYFIGGTDNANDGDSYITSVTDLTTNSAIRFVGSALSQTNGFSFPSTLNSTTTGGRFGPNFTFSLVTSAVPEPATWGLMILGFGMIGGSLRRRSVSTVRTRIRFV